MNNISDSVCIRGRNGSIMGRAEESRNPQYFKLNLNLDLVPFTLLQINKSQSLKYYYSISNLTFF